MSYIKSWLKDKEELKIIAEKAKYSQHPVEPGSIEKLEKALKNAKKTLRKHSFIRKLHYRWILNLY